MAIECLRCGEIMVQGGGLWYRQCKVVQGMSERMANQIIGGRDTVPEDVEQDRVRIPADNPGIDFGPTHDDGEPHDFPSQVDIVRSSFESCASILDPLSEPYRMRVINALVALYDA